MIGNYIIFPFTYTMHMYLLCIYVHKIDSKNWHIHSFWTLWHVLWRCCCCLFSFFSPLVQGWPHLQEKLCYQLLLARLGNKQHHCSDTMQKCIYIYIYYIYINTRILKQQTLEHKCLGWSVLYITLFYLWDNSIKILHMA